MKILFIPSWYPSEDNKIRGSFFKEQAEALAEYGIETTVLNIQIISLKSFKKLSNNYYYTQEGNLEVHTLKIIKWVPKSRRYQRYIYQRALYKLLRQLNLNEYNLIHCHSFFNAGLAMAKYKKKQNLAMPLFLTEHSSLFLRDLVKYNEKKLIVKYKNMFTSTISVSKELAKVMGLYGFKEVMIIPNIVDLDVFYNRNIREKQAKKLIAVGFLNKNKAFDILIKAFNKVIIEIPEATLNIVGEGDEFINLHRLVKDLNLENKIKFLGLMDRMQTSIEMNKANLLVSSSLNETFGVVLIEANATGLPVVSTKSGGPNNIVKNYNGKLAEKNNIDDLADKIIYVLENIENYDSSMISNETSKFYSKENIVNKLYQLYESELKL